MISGFLKQQAYNSFSSCLKINGKLGPHGSRIVKITHYKPKGAPNAHELHNKLIVNERMILKEVINVIVFIFFFL